MNPFGRSQGAIAELASDKAERAFYGKAVYTIVTRNPGKVFMHYPDAVCFNGECGRRMHVQCNWQLLINLVKIFWKEGPDMNDGWNRRARQRGFDSGELHELLLGVFIGADGGYNPFRYDDEFPIESAPPA